MCAIIMYITLYTDFQGYHIIQVGKSKNWRQALLPPVANGMPALTAFMQPSGQLFVGATGTLSKLFATASSIAQHVKEVVEFPAG
jgi:hypothetical protein